MASIRRAILVTTVAISATVLAPPAPAAAASPPPKSYTYVDLGVLPGVPSGTGRSSAQGVNLSGQVTGASQEPGRLTGVAYLYSNGRMVSLGSILPGYFASSFGSAINDAGVVVGSTSVTTTDPPHAFVFRNGVMSDLGTGFRAGSYSHATDVSNAGHIVGLRSATQLGTTRASMWRNGRITDLPGLSTLDSEANAVNDSGQVAGQSRNPSGAWRAVLWSGGRVTDLGTLGSDHEAAAAYDLSNTGAVVGSAPTAGGQVHAFLWREGKMEDLGTLPDGDGFSVAYGVNSSGLAVGVARVPGGDTDHRNRAVVFDSGTAIDLNTRVVNPPAGVSLYSANAINDNGVIVGNSCLLPCNPLSGFAGTAFMLIPNP